MDASENHSEIWSNICDICESKDQLSDIRPWLLALTLDRSTWPTAATLNAMTQTLYNHVPWHFVKQEPVPRRAKSRGMASLSGYLQLVLEQQTVPLRDGILHDVLNALTFIMFPEAKAALARRHFNESPSGIQRGQNRTRTQDLLTILDEGGVLRLVDPKGEQRDLIFGHAIYEHIIEGRRLRAARLDLFLDDEIFGRTTQQVTALADHSLARWLSIDSHCRSANEFSSLEIQ
jgi:hypothetical protein